MIRQPEMSAASIKSVPDSSSAMKFAWVGTHRPCPDGNQPYIASYIFAYVIDLPPGAREVRLPNDPRSGFLHDRARVPYRLWPRDGVVFAGDGGLERQGAK